MTKKLSEDIARRVEQVRENMAKAADRAGRKVEEITLVGVTKTQSVEAVRALLAAGVDDIGENKVQELVEKQPFLSDLPHKTHLIGHLQRNKTKFLPGAVDMVQSVDSVRIAEALDKTYSEAQGPLDVLIEVNIGEESNKAGVSKENLPLLTEKVRACKNLRLRGLMAIPPFGLGEGVRRYFRQMRQLFIDITAKKMDNEFIDNLSIDTLSMGMSADYEIAIEEGATMIRVGTDLFGPRQ